MREIREVLGWKQVERDEGDRYRAMYQYWQTPKGELRGIKSTPRVDDLADWLRGEEEAIQGIEPSGDGWEVKIGWGPDLDYWVIDEYFEGKTIWEALYNAIEAIEDFRG